MVVVVSDGQMADTTKDSTLMTRRKDKVSLNGQMVENTWDCGS